ncbi:MAG: hypothetical protein NC115_08585 [Bacteroidales bacterium]|nr:hypothetical protein [Bacteroides sp.]MCM1198127.1 hypothetical protein [Clostridium sp.]MCM1502702.1 hypothetical protein [Bacteroidales bacterium]
MKFYVTILSIMILFASCKGEGDPRDIYYMNIVNNTQQDIAVKIKDMSPSPQEGFPEGYTITIKSGDTFKCYTEGDGFDILDAEVIFDGEIEVIHNNMIQKDPKGFKNMCRRENWETDVIRKSRSGRKSGGLIIYKFTFEPEDYEYALTLKDK